MSKRGGTWEPPSLEEMQKWLPQFEFLSLLGRGGMGVVYKARQLTLNRCVAIKMLPAHLLVNDESGFAARFRLEARTMAKLSHPGIVSIFDSGETHGLLYIVMEYVDGTDLARIIQSSGKLPSSLTIEMLQQVCEALEYAHEHGIVHRDLKPANLLVTQDGRVKIADFGLAKQNEEALSGLTKTNVAIGTPEFLAPEAWIPGILLDRRADLYSIGVTLYQMLTGEVPRGLWKMPSIKAGTDPRFDAIVDRAMQPERDCRYQSSQELRADLNRIASEPLPGDHNRNADSPSNAGEMFPRLSATGLNGAKAKLVLAVALPLIVVLFYLLVVSERKGDEMKAASLGTTNASSSMSEPTVRDAALWLLREGADFSIVRNGEEVSVVAASDIPQGAFEIVRLSLDRWKSSPPEPPPPMEQFGVLRAVKTLRHVYLRLPGVTDEALAFLEGNPELRTLTAAGSKLVTDRVLGYIEGMKHLESVCISHATKLRGRDLSKAAWLNSVKHMDFLNAALDDEAIRVISTCPRLRSLRLEGNRMTVEGLSALANASGVVEMSVGYPQRLTEEDFAEVLPEFSQLKKLELVYAPIGDEGVKAIVGLTNLVELHLTGTKVGDEGLKLLGGLNRLRTMVLSGTLVSEEGVEGFQDKHPQCQIVR